MLEVGWGVGRGEDLQVAGQSVGCSSVAAGVAGSPALSLLNEVFQTAEFTGALSDVNLEATVFLPTNAAFSSLIAGLRTTKEELLKQKALLTRVLQLHVVPGRALAVPDLLSSESPLVTLAAETLTVNATEVALGAAIVPPVGRAANILAGNFRACGAVAHVIDAVLLPTTASTQGFL
ncbi:unnamed protein product [Ostreobium quekettii]|uniref:FAS1 domain-containing protein n=1 Tax=Ostreobium quekettii TaxID=121088 RepID=A0A8S1IY67_9CHLO|nr:unnamed protein product [Ostreobium quekettii]|eukprot:evm.model.scf_433.3 EVM.evm.TU.scf_433.3   scf_433:37367-41734(+)